MWNNLRRLNVPAFHLRGLQLFALFLLMAFAGEFGRAQAAVSLVQHTSKDAGTTTSSTLAFTSSNTAGNWLAVCIRGGLSSSQVFTVSDSNGNTYKKAAQIGFTGSVVTLAIYYAENVKGGANTVSVSMTVSGPLRFAISEYSGVSTSSSIDVTSTATATSTSPSSGSLTTSASGDLLLAAVASTNSQAFTGGAGYTVRDFVPVEPGTKLITEDQVQTTAGSASAGASISSSDAWGVVLAAFKPAGGVAGVPATITATAGTPQSATVSTAFATQLQATVKDSSNNPVSGVTVTFAAPGSGASGTFAGGVTTATTNASGIATSAVFTANGAAGSYTVTASVSGVASPANFSLTNLVGAAASITATAGTPQSATVNTAFGVQLQATVKDSFNNPVSGATVTFAAPGSGASGTFAGGVNTATTNASGVATAAVFTANTTAGAYAVMASVSGVASPANYSLTNLAGAAASITATAGTPQTATVNTAFGTQLQAIVKDSFNNPVNGVTVTFIAPGGGASGTFAGGVSNVTTSASGVATAPVFTANSTAGSYSVTASVFALPSPANFSLTNLTGAPASITATAGTPQSAIINTTFATQLQATVKDSFGNGVSGVTVTFAAPGSGASGTFANGVNTATTSASGVATAAVFTANSTTGTYTVTASVSGVATLANFSLTNLGPPAHIVATAGTPQSATINTTFAAPLQVMVTDSGNNPLSGVTVTFAAPGSGASVTFIGGANPSTTNASGVAASSFFIANSTAGSYTVTASVSGVASPANFSLTNVAGAAASIAATAGTPQSATVNVAFVTQLQATVKDSGGNPVSGVTVTFAAPGSGASGTFAGGVNTATTNASGVATSGFFTANSVAGSYTVTASVSGVASPANYSLTNVAGAANSITATAGTPQSATVNAAFATQLQATVKDSFSNPVSGAVVTFAAPGSGASGAFAGGVTTATTNASGVATAAVFTANGTTGSYTVTASVSGVATAANFSLTNTAAPPASITATAGTPQSATVNTAFTTAFQATVKDASNNPVSGVTVTFAAPGSGASGTFAGGVTTATTNSLGVATAAAFTANSVAGSYTVTASVSGVATAANFSLTNLAGAAASITASAGTPQSATVNTAFATQLQATVKDAGGNPVSGVTVTFAAPGTGASGTFAGGVNTATTNASGVATAAVFTANAIAGGPYNVTASVSGVSTSANFALTNFAGSAASITATAGTPQSATVNTAFAAQFQATVKDSFGNPINGITVTFNTPGSGVGPNGTFAAGVNTATTNASGVATAAVFTANGAAGSYSVTAAVSGVSTPANFSLTNLAGSPASISATAGTPQSATINTAFAAQIQATVKDSFGNLVSGVTVTFTGPSSGAGGTFAGGVNSAITNAQGVATAAVFTANSTTGVYTVTASVSGVAPSANFSLTNLGNPPANVAATAGTPQSAPVNTAFAVQFQVTVTDSSNNPVNGVTVTFAAPGGGASGTFGGGVNTAVTNASGVATAAVFTANGTLGSYTVTATVLGVSTPASFALTNVTGPAASITATAGTPQSAKVGIAFAVQLQATVRDSGGNPVSGATVTFTPPGSGPSGTFAGGVNTATTNSSGIATAAVFTANNTAGGPYIVIGSVPGVITQGANFSLTNLGGAPASIITAGGTPQSATVNTAFAAQLQAAVLDSFNNPVSGVTVTFAAPGSGASGTFAGGVNTATTNASGIAIAAVFTANGTTGSYIVTASVSGVSTPANFSLTNTASVAVPIALVQHTSKDAGTTTSTTLAFTKANTAGNWIAVSIRGGLSSSQVFTISDSNSNTYKKASQLGFTGSVVTTAIYYAENIKGGANTVSVSMTVSGPLRIAIAEYSGVATSSSLDGAVAATSSSSSPNSGNLTTTANGDLLLGNISSTNSQTFTAGAGYTIRDFVPVEPSTKLITEDQIQTTAGSVSAAASLSSSDSWGAILAAFKPATGGGGAGVPASIAATAGTPQSATVNTAFGTQLQATVKDSLNNPVSGVTVTFVAQGSGASGTFAGGVTTATTNASGVATAAVFTANTTAGAYTVTASVSGVATAANYSLTNVAGAANSITATAGTPQSATINTAFTTALQATVKDSFGNAVSGATVTFAAPGSGASGTFAGGVNTATTNASGVATGVAFTANGTTGSYTVTASASGVVATANFSLTNVSAPPASITATAGTPQSATINTAFTTAFQATVKDASNNPVSGVTVTFAAPGSGASGTFAGGVTTATTNASGVATAVAFTANGTTGSYTVTASVSGVVATANFSLTNVSAPPASITATAGTPQSATVNTAFTTAFQATVKDASNNPVSGVTVTFAAPGSGASGTFAGGVTTATTNSLGVATAAAFTANAIAGGPYNVTASVSGVATPANFAVTNLAGPAANITATAGTPQSATVRTAFATQLQATVTDSLNNPVSGVTVTFTAPASGASGTFAGGVNTATTNTQGVATAPVFTANATAGGPYTVTASVSGIATSANFSLTNLLASANIALVQHRNMDASTTTSNSLAFANSTTAGNFIAVCIRGSASSPQVFTVTDSSGNTYHQVFSFGVSGSLETLAIFYAENINGGPDTINVTQSLSGTLRFAILEYSGVATSNALDGTPATGQGNSSTPSTGNLTTTANGDLLLATIVTENTVAFTAGSGYTIEESVEASPNTKIIAEDSLQSTAGTASAGASTSAGGIWGAGLAAFRSTSGTTSPISVTVSPTAASVPAGYGTQVVTASVFNDFLNRGATWSLSGAGCSGSACGTLTRVTTTSVTFNAPLNIPNPATVTLTATSVGDATKSASATITITQGVLTVVVTPKRAGVTMSASQTVQFTGNVYNDPSNSGVTWQVDGNNGGTAASGTISSTGLYTPGTAPGQHSVTAVSNANASVSGSALIAVTDLVGVYTHHNDNARTGQNLQEYGLTPATVSSATFGQLFSCPVDGVVFAQPLWVANLTIGGNVHNVVFIATEHNSVYAFDADSPSCTQLWQVNFLGTGVTTLTSADVNGNTDIVPEIGITSTPVIDPSSNTIYVMPKTRETVGTVNGQACSSASPCYVHRLHALDLATGAEKFGGPVVITATNFVPQKHLQRPALLLANSTLYIAFGSHGDQCNYQGWLMGYNPSTLAQLFADALSNPTVCNQGAIWHPSGPSADASGNVYFVTANGLYDGTANFGDSAVKMSPTGSMPPLDWFTPFNQATLAANDVDLGSAGVVILPDSVGSAAHPHLALLTGKTAILYLLDQTNMGKFNSSSNNDVQEVIPVPPTNTTLDDGGNYGAPAYWNGNIYSTGQNYPLSQFQIANGVISIPQFAKSSNTFPPRGGVPSVSANGTSGGIVWIIDYTGFQDNTPAILDAYDATNVGTMLYSSPASGAGAAGVAVKFTAPTVANAKVYVGGQFVFTVYGLLPN